MRVKTESAQTFDFTLTGHEHQDTFDITKYQALASGNPQGAKLQELVEDNWTQWLEIVEGAPWLRNWLLSPLYEAQGNAVTPSGAEIEGNYKRRKIASALYSEATWGYGLAGWLNETWAQTASDAMYSATLEEKKTGKKAKKAILLMQNVHCPNQARTYMWDDKIYRGCGILVPCEFGELDRWLQPLWVEACSQVSQAANSRKG